MRGQSFRQLDSEVARAAVIQGIPAIRGFPINICTASGRTEPGTVLLITASTVGTVSQASETGLSLGTDPYPITDL
jgi:hypothetical protein